MDPAIDSSDEFFANMSSAIASFFHSQNRVYMGGTFLVAYIDESGHGGEHLVTMLATDLSKEMQAASLALQLDAAEDFIENMKPFKDSLPKMTGLHSSKGFIRSFLGKDPTDGKPV